MASTRRTAKKSLGKAFTGDTAVVILRSNDVLNRVTILERSFGVETPDQETISIPTNKIKTIVYKNLPSYPRDMLRTVNGSEFNGVILNDPIAMTSEDTGGTVKLPKAKILSIVW